MLFYLLSIFLFQEFVASCPVGSIQGLTPDHCYVLPKYKIDWSEAEEMCNSYGGHITSILSAFENAFLQKQAQQAFAGVDSYYIGGNNMLGQWTWIDASLFEYVNWDASVNIGKDDIGVIYQNITTGTWFFEEDDGHNLTERNYICRVPNGTPDCGKEGVYYYSTNKCYMQALDSTFSSDVKFCQNTSSNLISLHSSQDDILLELVTSYFAIDKSFIGLHQVDGKWQWTDGTPVDYTNWDSNGEPKYPNTTCVIADGQWSGGDEIACEIMPAIISDVGGICQSDTRLTPVTHISEQKQLSKTKRKNSIRGKKSQKYNKYL